MVITQYRLYRHCLHRHRIRHQQVRFSPFFFEVYVCGYAHARARDIYLIHNFISSKMDVVVVSIAYVCLVAVATAATSWCSTYVVRKSFPHTILLTLALALALHLLSFHFLARL